MRHTVPHAPQFYVTAPQPCPYLHGRAERKLFTALQGEHAAEQRPVAAGLSPVAECAVPAQLRKLRGLHVGADPGKGFPAITHAAAADKAQPGDPQDGDQRLGDRGTI